MGAVEKQATKVQKSDFDEKLAALKQYRRKNGLCFNCDGKWSPNHSCPEHVPLHVLEPRAASSTRRLPLATSPRVADRRCRRHARCLMDCRHQKASNGSITLPDSSSLGIALVIKHLYL
jgi:hypothetical protein